MCSAQRYGPLTTCCNWQSRASMASTFTAERTAGTRRSPAGSGKPFEARPIYYGLQMCRSLLGTELVAANIATKSANVSVYALRNPRRLVVVNKETKEAAVRLTGGERATQVARLTAHSPFAKAGISLAVQTIEPATVLAVTG